MGIPQTGLLLFLCVGVRVCYTSCVPCFLGLNITGEEAFLSSSTQSRNNHASLIDFKSHLTTSIRYNYTVQTKSMALLGILGCLSFSLHQIENGYSARLATINDRLFACSHDKFHLRANLTRYDLMGAFVFRHFTPRVLQWSTVAICLVALLIALT